MKEDYDRFPIYSKLLKLYPKQYRDRFGDEILQTTADMLDAADTKRERYNIWIRVAVDTFVYGVYQQFKNIGELVSMNIGIRIIISVAWLAISAVAVFMFPELRKIGTEWMNTEGFLRIIYLSLYCIFLIAGPIVMALLALLSRPKGLYKLLTRK